MPKKTLISSNQATASFIVVKDAKPTRPLSAYNFFFQEERKKMLAKLPVRNQGASPGSRGKIGFGEMARTVAAKWKVIDSETKKRLDDMAREAQVEFRKKVKAWRKSSKKNTNAGVEKADKRHSEETTGLNRDLEEQEDELTSINGPSRVQDIPQSDQAFPLHALKSNFSVTSSYEPNGYIQEDIQDLQPEPIAFRETLALPKHLQLKYRHFRIPELERKLRDGGCVELFLALFRS